MLKAYLLDPYLQVQVDMASDAMSRVIMLADHVEPLLDGLSRVFERNRDLAHEVTGLLFVINEVFERPESAETKQQRLKSAMCGGTMTIQRFCSYYLTELF